jgi:hypothetical protein
MNAQFERFALSMTRAQAAAASHPGPCDADVAALARVPAIQRQLAKLDPAVLRDELREYGAWDAVELSDHAANLERILWIAAGNIAEEAKQ